MDDIRLKTADLTVGGRIYKVCCNMNVLADVQEMCGGKIGRAIYDVSTKGLLRWVTAMINDARDSAGETPLTIKEVGRSIPMGDMKEIQAVVTTLLKSSLRSADGGKEDGAVQAESAAQEEEEGKNSQTTQN